MFEDIAGNSSRRFRLSPLTIVAVYVVFGSFWAITLAWLLLHFTDNVTTLTYLQIAEDVVFILLTAVPLYIFIKRLETKVRQGSEQYRDLIEFLPIAIGIYRDGRLVYANSTGLAMVNQASLPDILGKSLFDLLSTDDNAAARQRIEAIEHGHAVPFVERRLILRDGSVLVAEVAGIPLSDAGGPAALLVARDITARKQLENERAELIETLEQRVRERTSELERRQRVAEGLARIVAKLNSNAPLDAILNDIAAQTSQVLGATATAIMRQSAPDAALTLQTGAGLLPPSVEHAAIALGQAAAGEAIAHGRAALVAPTAELPGTVAVRGELLRHAGTPAPDLRTILAMPLAIKQSVYGALVLYFPAAHAVSAQDVEIAAVLSDQIALAIEHAHLLEAVEEKAALAERNRLAHDLHDSISQVLFSASLIAEVLPSIWNLDQAEGLRRLEELRHLTRGALAEMRTLLHELRPAGLEETPLPELLRHLVEATMGRAGIPIDLVIEGESTLSPATRVALYRIAQQALDNVFRHAQATHAQVSLRSQPDGSVTLQIADSGRGFEPAHVPPGHLGIAIMRERAEALGASLEIHSVKNQGTRITVHGIIDHQEGAHA